MMVIVLETLYGNENRVMLIAELLKLCSRPQSPFPKFIELQGTSYLFLSRYMARRVSVVFMLWVVNGNTVQGALTKTIWTVVDKKPRGKVTGPRVSQHTSNL